MTAPAGRVERAVLHTVLLGVGGASMAVAWVHVKAWTMHHVAAGTGDWVGWVNAAVSELVPVAAALVIRRRRAAGQPYGMPVFVLAAFGGFSLAAQVAEAPPSPSGWLLAAVPSLGAAAVIKLVLSVPARRDTVAADRVPARTADRTAGPVTATAAVPVTGPPTARTGRTEAVRAPAESDPAAAAVVPVDLADLLLLGRAVAAELAHAGRPLTRTALIDGLRGRGRRISTDRAGELLRRLRDTA
jgi:hypothetical protein